MPRPDGEDPQLQVFEILQNRNRFHRVRDAAADQDLPNNRAAQAVQRRTRQWPIAACLGWQHHHMERSSYRHKTAGDLLQDPGCNAISASNSVCSRPVDRPRPGARPPWVMTVGPII